MWKFLRRRGGGDGFWWASMGEGIEVICCERFVGKVLISTLFTKIANYDMFPSSK